LISTTPMTVPEATSIAQLVQTQECWDANMKVALTSASTTALSVTAGNARKTLQDYTQFVHYFTETEWIMLLNANVGQHCKMSSVIGKCCKLGLSNPSEPTYKIMTSLFLILTRGYNEARMMDPEGKRDMLLHFKSAMKTSTLQVSMMLDKLPTPRELAENYPDFFKSAFPDDFPVTCKIEECMLGGVAIPMRSTHKLLRHTVLPFVDTQLSKQEYFMKFIGQMFSNMSGPADGCKVQLLKPAQSSLMDDSQQSSPATSPRVLQSASSSLLALGSSQALLPLPAPENPLDSGVPSMTPAPLDSGVPSMTPATSPSPASRSTSVEAVTLAICSSIAAGGKAKPQASMKKRPAAAIEGDATDDDEAKPKDEPKDEPKPAKKKHQKAAAKAGAKEKPVKAETKAAADDEGKPKDEPKDEPKPAKKKAAAKAGAKEKPVKAETKAAADDEGKPKGKPKDEPKDEPKPAKKKAAAKAGAKEKPVKAETKAAANSSHVLCIGVEHSRGRVRCRDGAKSFSYTYVEHGEAGAKELAKKWLEQKRSERGIK
jgi:hypothetical protein